MRTAGDNQPRAGHPEPKCDLCRSPQITNLCPEHRPSRWASPDRPDVWEGGHPAPHHHSNRSVFRENTVTASDDRPGNMNCITLGT